MALTDALGNLADFCLLPGQAHDLRGVPDLIDGLQADQLLADRAFDADWLRLTLSEQDIAPVIPPTGRARAAAGEDHEHERRRERDQDQHRIDPEPAFPSDVERRCERHTVQSDGEGAEMSQRAEREFFTAYIASSAVASSRAAVGESPEVATPIETSTSAT